jgi:hypothetical protein
MIGGFAAVGVARLDGIRRRRSKAVMGTAQVISDARKKSSRQNSAWVGAVLPAGLKTPFRKVHVPSTAGIGNFRCDLRHGPHRKTAAIVALF